MEERSAHKDIEVSPRAERLETWGEIAAYLGREVRTVQRWEKSLGLPIHRLAGFTDKQSRVFALRGELDAWWREHERVGNAAESEDHLSTAPAAGQQPPTSDTSPASVAPTRWSAPRVLTWATVAIISALLAIPVIRTIKRAWPSRITLAVEPFQNLGNRTEDFIADGLTQEMIARLGQLHPTRLSVLPLPAANKLGSARATYVLRGTVRSYGDQVAITAELVQTSNQSVAWGGSYQRDVKDLLRVQAEVANAIAVEVFNTLPNPGAPVREVNRDAYLAYLEGRYFWARRTAEDIQKAEKSFQNSIGRDPTYAPAYAGLADCYELLASAPYTILRPSEAFPKAEAAARKALELDPSLSEAHVSLGYADLAYDWDFGKADAEFRRAIELRPNYATAHQFYGYSLTVMGRLPEAIAERKKAVELDPTSPLMASALGEAYYQARMFDKTIELNQRALDLDGTYAIALVNIGRAYQQKGMHPQAQAAFQKVLAAAPENPAVFALLGHEFAVAGRRDDAIATLGQLKDIAVRHYVPSLYFALIYTGLNDRDNAFRWMNAAVQERTEYLIYLGTEPVADPLRSDARFPDLMKRIGLHPEAVPHGNKLAANLDVDWR